MTSPRFARRTGAGALALTLALTGLAPVAAQAATAPVVQPAAQDAPDFSAQGLPTVQVDGVVLTLDVAGNRAFAGGTFAAARPAGAAPRTSETPRANLLAFDVTTGALDPAFRADTDGKVLDVAVSDDGATLYVVGEFSTVSGQPRNGFAALDAATGALRPLDLQVTGSVAAVDTRGNLVYVGGAFSKVRGQEKWNVAAVDATTGALTRFGADVRGPGSLRAIEVSPDGRRVAMGGQFDSVDGTAVHGLALVDVASNALVPSGLYSVNTGGTSLAGVLDLDGDETGFYAGGFGYSDRALEGTLSADWDGTLRWLADCHGDSTGVWSSGRSVHYTGHPYSCASIGSFPERSPRSYNALLSVTNAASTTAVATAVPGYENFAGMPAPAIQAHFPDLAAGDQMGQATWAVSGNSDYMVVGGEFPAVNGIPQAGLVRFARRGAQASDRGPIWTDLGLRAVSRAPGQVQVTVTPTWDRDDDELTYRIIRDGKVLDERRIRTSRYGREDYAVIDALPAGTTGKYWVHVIDSDGNLEARDVDVTSATGTAGTTPTDAYRRAVAEDGVRFFLEEGATGAEPIQWSSGAARAPGLMGEARRMNGTIYAQGNATERVQAPWVFSTEVWVNVPARSTRSGPFIGMGNTASGTSSARDRVTYMTKDGRVAFGTYPADSARVLQTTAKINDGAWHHVVSTLDGTGLRTIYIDGTVAAQERMASGAQDFVGYWRVGAERLTGWPGADTASLRASSVATIDAPAVYNRVLTQGEVARHHALGLGKPDPRPTPTPDPTPDPTPTPAPTPTPTVPTPAEPGVVIEDAFTRTNSGSWGVALVGGAWTSWGASVDGSSGILAVTPGTGPGARNTNVAALETVSTFSLGFDALPTTPLYLTIGTRQVGAERYETKLTVAPDGSLTLGLVSVAGGTTSYLASRPVAGVSAVPGQRLDVEVAAVGSAPTQLTATVWPHGQARPAAPQVSATDTTAALQRPGGVAFETYLGSAATRPVRVSVDDWTTRVPAPVVTPVGLAVDDAFSRTLGAGWGVAQVGGPWTTWGTTAVDGSAGVLTTGAGGGSGARSGAAVRDAVTDVVLSTDAVPSANQYVTLAQRQVGAERYETKLVLRPDGGVQAGLVAVSGGSTRYLASAPVEGLSTAGGAKLHVRMSTLGESPSRIELSMWPEGSPEPAAPQFSVPDASPELQRAGTVGLEAYLAGGATRPVSLAVDSWTTRDPSAH